MHKYQVVNEQKLKPYARLFQQYQEEWGFEYELAEVYDFLSKRLTAGDALLRSVTTNKDEPQSVAIILPSLSSLSMRLVWVISDLYTLPNARRKGCAEFLLNAIEQEARQQSIFSLRIQTIQNNEAAIALYKKLDYGVVNNLKGFAKVLI